MKTINIINNIKNKAILWLSHRTSIKLGSNFTTLNSYINDNEEEKLQTFYILNPENAGVFDLNGITKTKDIVYYQLYSYKLNRAIRIPDWLFNSIFKTIRIKTKINKFKLSNELNNTDKTLN